MSYARFPVLQTSRREILDALADRELTAFADFDVDSLTAATRAATPDRLSVVATRAGELVKKAMLEQSGGDWRHYLIQAAAETFGYAD